MGLGQSIDLEQMLQFIFEKDHVRSNVTVEKSRPENPWRQKKKKRNRPEVYSVFEEAPL